MREPIENEYFNWLCAKVLSVKFPVYFDLMRTLYQTEYCWMILGDRNRAEDGVELRTYFVRETDWEPDPLWYEQACSVLEMLIALAKRANFQTEIPVKDWFWIFIKNLRLEEYRQVSRSDAKVIEDILHTFLWRRYNPLGEGGLFPLRVSARDQTKLELWFQFNEYLEDQGL